jgi:hypothetical protein
MYDARDAVRDLGIVLVLILEQFVQMGIKTGP